ncbi:MAG TPA: 50S ribosomal protein L17 [Vicinamibacterales bacterium]|nr:50S ribosomal protein L17 [Vicinamibacterales bacterium]
MRHRVAHRKLGRVTEHRISMLRNLATALLRHEHIRTTVPRAKELRPFVERLISVAKRGLAGGTANAQLLHARRLVLQDIDDRAVVGKLFDTIAPRFAARSGGYTRILRVGFRRGDAADMAQIELVGSEFNPKAAAEADAKREAGRSAAQRGVGDRLRAAASRIRGKKAEGDEAEKAPKKTAKRGKAARAQGDEGGKAAKKQSAPGARKKKTSDEE